MTSSAVLSDCGTYRYALARTWRVGAGRQVCWVMLNPSTADAEQDDPTIRRCIGFSKAWGFGSLIVVNLFALRSTDPKALHAHVDPVGPDNDAHIAVAAATSDRIVCAWGAGGVLANRGLRVLDVLAPLQPAHLGLTKGNQPRHPLYARADARLSWSWPA